MAEGSRPAGSGPGNFAAKNRRTSGEVWGRVVSCAPIGHRRKVGRLTIGPQVANLPHNQIDPPPRGEGQPGPPGRENSVVNEPEGFPAERRSASAEACHNPDVRIARRRIEIRGSIGVGPLFLMDLGATRYVTVDY
jgi:hypothetical protein